MEEKDANMWWGVVHDIVQKYIGKVCRRYERNERLYKHIISQMEKVISSFQYEPLVLTPKPKTSNEEKERGKINGARPSNTRTEKEELANFRGGKDSPQKEVGGMTYASK
jgi:hypothetical protein